jgi:tRNA threonylcarbamoyladenosine biosynthesis protein TsaB
MLILSLDSAGAGCSACLWRDESVLAAATEPMERGQDRRLMPLILGVMEQASMEFSTLDRIAVTRGPGSFTGLRIGLAAARGIGLAADKSVFGIDRFAIYREQIKGPGKNLLVVIDSKRSGLFCRFYPAKGAPQEPRMLSRDDIAAFLDTHKNTIVTGDTPVANADFHPPVENEAVTCAALAAHAAPGDAAFLPRPLYIRAPDVTFPRTAKSA